MHQIHDNSVAQLSLPELRKLWQQYWGIKPYRYIGRQLLEKSIQFKQKEQTGYGLSIEDQVRLDQLVRAYKRNPKNLTDGTNRLKPGTRLEKTIDGIRHVVTVVPDGFEYKGQTFSSLSVIASTITGTRWNGWVFFGLKKRGAK